MVCNNSKTVEQWLIHIIKWSFFVACLSGFVIQSYDSIRKYISCPQVLEVSTEKQENLDFPEITFCPYHAVFRNADPTAYNWTKLESCEVNLDNKFNGSSIECQDPKKVWEYATPYLKDFGVKTIKIDSFMKLNVSELDFQWRGFLSEKNGACYSLHLSKEIRQKAISMIYFNILESKHFEIFFHSKGLLSLNPLSSLDFKRVRLKQDQDYTLFVDYTQKKVLDFAGSKCIDDQDYNYRDCVEKRIQVRDL